MIRRHALAALAAIGFALALFSPQAAHAASVEICAPTEAGKAEGPRRYTNPNTTNVYTSNSAGCLLTTSADLGWFLSQGFTLGSPYYAVTSAGNTAAFSLVIPAGAFIRDIIAQETSGGAVTGGLKIGTTSGGTDVVVAATLAANGLITTPEVSLLKRVFSSTVPQTLFVGAVSSFANSAVNVTVVYGYF